MAWNWPMLILTAIIGYLLGNFSSGIVVARVMGHEDIRKVGSGNAGTTNVLRTLGWLPSGLTFLGDVLKGLVAALIGRLLCGAGGAVIGAMTGGIFAVLGHNWPALFAFRGGKGMATSLGAIFIVDWRIALVLIAVQVAVLLITHYMSLASLLSCVANVVATLCWHGFSWPYLLFALILSGLGVYSHRANIRRLLSNSENRLNAKKISDASRERKKHG